MTVHWLLILFYTILVGLVTHNIVVILIMQGRWKSLPILLFYIWSFIAILIREIMSIYGLPTAESTLFLIINYLQPIAKLCAGLTQACMIIQMAVEIR